MYAILKMLKSNKIIDLEALIISYQSRMLKNRILYEIIYILYFLRITRFNHV
jgi:hypothetical protein